MTAPLFISSFQIPNHVRLTMRACFNHVNNANMNGFCVTESLSESGGENDFYSTCFVCHLDLSSFDSSALKEAHLNTCLNAIETKVAAEAPPPTVDMGMCENESEADLIDFQSILSQVDGSSSHSGLRSNDFACIICDLDLSRRGITARCHHLKRLAANF
jgi:hypothetical protein